MKSHTRVTIEPTIANAFQCCDYCGCEMAPCSEITHIMLTHVNHSMATGARVGWFVCSSECEAGVLEELG